MCNHMDNVQLHIALEDRSNSGFVFSWSALTHAAIPSICAIAVGGRRPDSISMTQAFFSTVWPLQHGCSYCVSYYVVERAFVGRCVSVLVILVISSVSLFCGQVCVWFPGARSSMVLFIPFNIFNFKLTLQTSGI